MLTKPALVARVVDGCMGMCTDMCADMRLQMCTYLCVDMRIRQVCRYEHRHVYTGWAWGIRIVNPVARFNGTGIVMAYIVMAYMLWPI